MGWKKWAAAGGGGLGLLVAVPVGVLIWTFAGNPPIVDGQRVGASTRVVADGYVALFLVEVGPRQFAMVDAGNDPAGGAIDRALSEAGATREEVVAVLLTHGHPDHTAACAGFPNATVYASKDELPLLAGEVAARGPLPRLFGAAPSPCAGVVGLDDGAAVAVGGQTATMFGIPGHTQGSAAWFVGGVLFLGDAADATADGHMVAGKWVFSDDVAQAEASLAALTERTRSLRIDALAFSHTGTLRGGLSPFVAPTEAAAPVPADPAWIDDAVARALAAEVMPGTTAEEDPARGGQLRAFFLAHREYADAARLDALLEAACAFGIEPTHERLVNPPPRTPLVVEVDNDAWRVVVAHAASPCTSDDWTWFTNTVSTAAEAQGIRFAYGGDTNDRLEVQRGGVTLATAALTGQGYLMLRAGKAPEAVAHDLPEEVLGAASRYFGLSLSAPPE